MNKIYIVLFYTGEYEDASEQSVCAFSSEEKAKDYCDRFNRYLLKHNLHMNQFNFGERINDTDTKVNPFIFDDKAYRVDYTGGNVMYYELELK